VKVSEGVEGFNSLSDVKQALIAITMFAVLWGGGAVLICILFRKQRLKIGTNSLRAKEVRNHRAEMTSVEANQYLIDYMDEVFPAVYQTSSSLLRLLREVMKHHRYLTIFSSQGEVSDGRRILICLQLLTVQSMVMFMIAALYEIQVRSFFFNPSINIFCNYFFILSSVLMTLAPAHPIRRRKHVKRRGADSMETCPCAYGRRTIQTLASALSESPGLPSRYRLINGCHSM
jgi:hypothetical protein